VGSSSGDGVSATVGSSVRDGSGDGEVRGQGEVGGVVAISVGLPGKMVEVAQTRMTAKIAIAPVKAVSDNFAEKFAGK
jgi:hypothetical protein